MPSGKLSQFKMQPIGEEEFEEEELMFGDGDEPGSPRALSEPVSDDGEDQPDEAGAWD